MKYPISYADINIQTEYYSEIKYLYKEAESYLLSFSWCKKILGCQLYTNLGKIFSIFLFQIENSDSPQDNFLWIVVGDLPPMYLDTFGVKSTRGVIDQYIGLASEWIDCAIHHKDLSECYPFHIKPTGEMIELLNKRIAFMKNTLIDNVDNIALTT